MTLIILYASIIIPILKMNIPVLQCTAHSKCSIYVYWINEQAGEIVCSVSCGIVAKPGLECRSSESWMQPRDLSKSLFLRLAHEKS